MPRSSLRLVAGAVAVSLLAHGVLLLVIALSDPAVNRSRPVREIPVELVVEEPAAPEKRRLEAGTREKSATPQEAAPGVKSAVAPLDPAKRAPDAPIEKLRNDIVNKEKAGEAEKAARGSARQAVHGGSGVPAGAFLALPFDSGLGRFRAAAVPLPSQSGGETMSYRFIVGGILERAKQYPGSARQRGARGIATVGFVLDPSGGVASVVLLRSSGDAELDAEGVALVTRAAPFPPPPPGAQQSFSIEVAFGMGH